MTSATTPTNADVADVLERMADLLRAQHANPHRVRAYEHAAETVRGLEEPLADVLARDGPKGLQALPGIGQRLASSIEEILHTGRFRALQRLEGESSPEDLFASVPGIGEGLAHRIHDVLHIETLEELELAAHDGRLEGVPGFGTQRAHVVRDTVGALLARSSRRRARLIRDAPEPPFAQPPVERLLELDARYRRLAGEGRLRRIAPRRFNPEAKAWLPVLHEEAGGWTFTALYSNTARAHQLGRTRDWVVLYFERDGHEGQCTVVTETWGPRRGLRVVRGREIETPMPRPESAGRASTG